jgi:hypothetical protein
VDPTELTAREQIRELVATYAHCADSGRFEELAALFDAEGVLETPDRRTFRGPAAILVFLTATKAQLAATNASGPIRHHVSSLHIELAGPDHAAGAAYFLVVTARGPDHWGRYRDRYVARDGRWRFAERRVRLDGRAAGT